jgi:UDP-N-acetylglucosamine 2-epimerase (non-hydrolysing)
VRVLIATDQWFPDVHAGPARLAAESARALAARGHEVIVLAPRGEPARASEAGMDVRRILRRGLLPQTLTDPRETRRRAAELGPFDVVLAHQSTTAAGILGLDERAPLVFMFHASAAREMEFLRSVGARRLATRLLQPALLRLERNAVRGADRILVLSEFSRSLLEADHELDAGRVGRVAAGVDADHFAPGDFRKARAAVGIPDDVQLLFTVRRLEPRMGLDRLVAAVPHTGCHLAIAGVGSMRPQLEAQAARLGLGARVRFLGGVSDEELVSWYRAADLVVVPTIAYEGFGMVTAEALACGAPVVGTPIGATPELLQPIDPALIAAGAEVEDLEAAIRRVLSLARDQGLRARCREHAVAHYAWAVAAREWEAELDRAAHGDHRWVAPTLSRAGGHRRTTPSRTDLLVVAGARPNFMKAASIVRAAERAGLSYSLVHTGQHYDHELSQVFFEELGLPQPDVYLGVGSASHAEQTARIMLAFEAELLRLDPAIVVVVGDVNSTLACALVAVKEHYPVAHVEAGLRCGVPTMAEEINRKLCDHVSEYLFTTSRDADENLLREGVAPAQIAFVGNTMIDTLLRFAESARDRGLPGRLGFEPGRYGVATLHRPENVDSSATLGELVAALVRISAHIPLVIPLHPRTASRLELFELSAALERAPGIHLSPPLGYLDFVGLLTDARLVLTDSGGVQEEATVLGVPCLTLRDSTERPVTVEMGTNRVAGREADAIEQAALAVLERGAGPRRIPELWDGRAGERIVTLLIESLFESAEAVSAHA